MVCEHHQFCFMNLCILNYVCASLTSESRLFLERESVLHPRLADLCGRAV
jgi:hypothetical protein